MPNPNDAKLIAKLLAKLGLDYIRWTQLVPMVLGWAFAIIMVLAMFLIAFQSDIDSFLSQIEPTVERVLGPAPEPRALENGRAENDTDTIRLTEDDIIPWIYRIWGVLAFIGWGLSIIRTKFFGPIPPKKLRRKIGAAALASLGFGVLLYVAYLLVGISSGNTQSELILVFTLLPLLLFVVSFWGLTISHIIDKLHKEVDKIGVNDDPKEMVRTTSQ